MNLLSADPKISSHYRRDDKTGGNRSRTINRRRFLAFALSAVPPLLAGCRDSSQSNGKVSLRWVVDPSPIRPKQIALFEKRYPDIQVVNDPDADPTIVLTQLAGDVPPDVFTIYTPDSVRLFASKDVLLDLRPYVKAAGVQMSNFWPQLNIYIYRNGNPQDQILGFPDNCGPYVLFYNKRMFRAAGLPFPTDNWTWQDFLSAAIKLTVRDRYGRPMQYGLVNTPEALPLIMIWQNGGSFFNQDGTRCTMDSAAAKAAVQFWANFRLKYKVMPTSSEEQSMASLGGWAGPLNLFKAEKVGMVITGRWLSIMWRQNPNLDWDIAAIPHSKFRTTLLGSKIYAIPKECRHQQDAFKFLKNIISPADEMLVADYGDGIPSVKSVCYSRQFLFNPKYPKERKNWLYLQQMRYARPPEFSPWIQQLDVDTIRTDEYDRIWQGSSGISPLQACEDITRRINEIIQRNRANPNLLY